MNKTKSAVVVALGLLMLVNSSECLNTFKSRMNQ